MKASILIELLQKLPADRDVMILDGWNGGGEPRTINFQTNRRITKENAANGADCENRVGEVVTVFGYGSY
jgi:hypothetical protein